MFKGPAVRSCNAINCLRLPGDILPGSKLMNQQSKGGFFFYRDRVSRPHPLFFLSFFGSLAIYHNLLGPGLYLLSELFVSASVLKRKKPGIKKPNLNELTKLKFPGSTHFLLVLYLIKHCHHHDFDQSKVITSKFCQIPQPLSYMVSYSLRTWSYSSSISQSSGLCREMFIF